MLDEIAGDPALGLEEDSPGRATQRSYSHPHLFEIWGTQIRCGPPAGPLVGGGLTGRATQGSYSHPHLFEMWGTPN